jgi:hypothetical protein
MNDAKIAHHRAESDKVYAEMTKGKKQNED